jgi:hypothetical protein
LVRDDGNGNGSDGTARATARFGYTIGTSLAVEASLLACREGVANDPFAGWCEKP